MSDLDSNAARVSTSSQITALANGKLPSYNRGVSPVGSNPGLVDGFAEVFAQMAASSPAPSKSVSVNRPEENSSRSDEIEPVDQAGSNESADESDASEELTHSNAASDSAAGVPTEQTNAITAEIETDETLQDDEATATEVATVVARDAKRITTADETEKDDVVVASSVQTETSVDKSLEPSRSNDAQAKASVDISSPVKVDNAAASTNDDVEAGATEVIAAASDFAVENSGGDDRSEDSPRDRRRGRQATRSAGESSNTELQNPSATSKNRDGFEIPDAIASQTGADEAVASDLHAMTEKAIKAVQNQTPTVSNVTQAVAATGQVATQSTGSLNGTGATDGDSSVRSPSMSIESPAGSRADADAKANASNTDNKNAADIMTRIKLIQRVSKAFQHLGPEGGVVRLRLAPAELGTVRVEMRIHQKKVEARVVADTEAASSALREHLPELRGRLEAMGMNVEKIEVETDSSFTQNDSSFNDPSSLADQNSDWNRQSQRSPRRPVSQVAGNVSRQAASTNSPNVPVGSYVGSGVDVRL